MASTLTETSESAILTGTQEWNEGSAASRTVRRKEPNTIKIDGQDELWSVAFLVDGRHFVAGGKGGRVRRWRTDDGRGVDTPVMNAGRVVRNIAVSQDGKWIVSATSDGVVVWNAKTREKATELMKGRVGAVCAVDVSPDSTRVATGSDDGAVYVLPLDVTGEQLLGPLLHDYPVVGVKFSPGGRLIATATQWGDKSIRIYDSQNGHLVVNFSVRVNSLRNQSLAWASDSKRLLALSPDGYINCLDMSTGMTLLQWPIHSGCSPTSIVLAANGAFVAAAEDFSVSFWDTTTHMRIGSIIQHSEIVESMAISPDYDIAISGGQTITLQSLRDVLPSSYCNDTPRNPETWHTNVEMTDYRETSESLVQEDYTLVEKIANLEKTVLELRNQLSDSKHTAEQEKHRFSEAMGSLSEKEKHLSGKIARLEKTVLQLRAELLDSKRASDHLARVLRVYERKHRCESLFDSGCINDAAQSLLEIERDLGEEVKANALLANWVSEFTKRCASKLELIGDAAVNVDRLDEALVAYSTVLSLGSATPTATVVKWAGLILTNGTLDEALHAATKFRLPRFNIYQAICDILVEGGRLSEAVEGFRRMQSELVVDTRFYEERAQWESGFRQRCRERLEEFGDAAMDSGNFTEAASQFSIILQLDPEDRMDLLLKRSKARASMNAWDDAISDADEAISLDPSCYRGYDLKHAALCGAKRYAEAAETYRVVLSKLEESPSDHIRKLRSQYTDAVPAIQRIVQQTIRTLPRVLIDTTTGRLCDKKQQAEAFEALPIYSELVSSMTRELDYARIWKEVKEFYRYVMLSHRWEDDEPLLQTVEHTTIYMLEPTSPNIKLQTFCSLARSFGFRWAWSDTCCIDKGNNVVLQESLVAMFTWYRGSSLTIVYLCGVSSLSQLPGDLRRSIWNTRAWTYQEYVAAEVVQFYTEDWKPYLDLGMFNHKGSPAIISEMQESTKQDIATLRPGLDRVREKLYLASTRQTTLVEDVAYSLLGIFNAAIPVIYGEGDRAVGRFLEHILTGSCDVMILAWTGRAGSYNSCLPPDLTVYDQVVPPHVPQPIETVEMDNMIEELQSSLPDLSAAVMLHDLLNKLPSPSFTASRLSLPCIVFSVTSLDDTTGSDSVSCSETNFRVYRAMTPLLGDVEINTMEDLSGLQDLLLIHPWISPLLDQEFARGAATLDPTTRALRLVARLMQPFGALLLAPVSRARYRRVAADCLIVVGVRGVALKALMGGIRTVDVQ